MLRGALKSWTWLWPGRVCWDLGEQLLPRSEEPPLPAFHLVQVRLSRALWAWRQLELELGPYAGGGVAAAGWET